MLTSILNNSLFRQSERSAKSKLAVQTSNRAYSNKLTTFDIIQKQKIKDRGHAQ